MGCPMPIVQGCGLFPKEVQVISLTWLELSGCSHRCDWMHFSSRFIPRTKSPAGKSYCFDSFVIHWNNPERSAGWRKEHEPRPIQWYPLCPQCLTFQKIPFLASSATAMISRS